MSKLKEATETRRVFERRAEIPEEVVGGEAAVGDWRAQVHPDSRRRIVNKIQETLKWHLPFSGPEGLLELNKIAVRFEEKIYAVAINQSDYLRKISLKMLTMEAPAARSNQIPQGPVIQVACPLQLKMDNNNSQVAQRHDQIPCHVLGGGGVAVTGMEVENWTVLQPDSRQRIVNRIVETLKQYPPCSGLGLQELNKMAVRFEEKIYAAATSQPDYLRKLSLKMLEVEAKSQNSASNSVHSNGASSSQNPQ